MFARGEPVILFDCETRAGESNGYVDCQGYNGLRLRVGVTGTNPSVVLTAMGAPVPGGPYVTLTDPNAVVTVTTSRVIDVVVGLPYARVQLSSLTGSFVSGQGFTVVGLGYVSPGPVSVIASVGS